ncbi:hypothetical protein HDU92_003590 [Lobulomyces angularis]|nr:hypothetical protein HDU92_003590 [Lobulomyces angularis]
MSQFEVYNDAFISNYMLKLKDRDYAQKIIYRPSSEHNLDDLHISDYLVDMQQSFLLNKKNMIDNTKRHSTHLNLVNDNHPSILRHHSLNSNQSQNSDFSTSDDNSFKERKPFLLKIKSLVKIKKRNPVF